MTPLYRARLPQLNGGPFLTDGGIETTLIFHDGLTLRDFAAFDLHRRPGGEEALDRYFRSYARIARQFGVGLVLESATWRASRDWGERLEYSPEALAEVNRRAVEFLLSIREEYQSPTIPVVISGCVGPRGDGYVPGAGMSAEEAEAYHAEQIAAFAAAPADLVTAITMTTIEEAVGVARAARRSGMPAVISFTVETDGALPTGQPLQHAIEETDRVTDAWPAYYMINCAHPAHFEHVLEEGAAWCDRVRGIRANASTRSHAELNEAPDLDEGDPVQLGADYARLLRRLRKLIVLGGCCGTDHRHIEQIAAACVPLMRLAT